MRHFFQHLSASIALSVLAFTPATAANWPEKPVNIVVSQGPGSGSDIMARLFGKYLSDVIDQSVIVENRPGASGTIGNSYVANSNSDGYTLLFSSTAPLLVAPLMLSDTTFKYTDLVPVAPIMEAQFVVLVANKEDSPTTLKELMAKIRAEDVSFSSSGQGMMTHLATERILKAENATAMHVPYKGSGQSLTDLMGGFVLFTTDSLTASMAGIKSERLRPLAVTGAERSPSLPNVPTLKELGYTDLTVTTLGGLFGPKELKPETIERIYNAVMKTLEKPELIEAFEKLDTKVLKMPQDEFVNTFDDDAKEWEQSLEELNLIKG